MLLPVKICRAARSTSEFLLAMGTFYRSRKLQHVEFQRLRFGFSRAMYWRVRGRKAEDPFRGLRAGPASFPRPLPPERDTPPTPLECTAGVRLMSLLSPARELSFRRCKKTCGRNSGSGGFRVNYRDSRRHRSNPCWGVVQSVGHLTVNEDGVGSSPTAPANSLQTTSHSRIPMRGGTLVTDHRIV
jgi:hypothetical protein